MLNYINVPYDKKLILLDVACGNGHFLKEAEKRVTCFGIDVSDVAVARAKKNATKSDIRRGQGEKLPYKDNYFDYVTCIGSLEHFINMEKGLSEMRRVMKPNAIANILVPNSDYLIFKFIGQPPLY
ncbi:MAG: class I SAM-dependent methyltransferase, partial [Candidatus Aenigmarchaeota archaeon]|nr:class I SAM-dependent methyltransferase [Candidatus Aenigmarchaeota archaeon]